MSKIILLIPLLILYSCKTTEEIQREQLVDNLSIQMVQNQKLTANSNLQIQDLEDKISQLQGNLEEKDHKNETTNKGQFSKIDEKIKLLEQAYQSNQAEFDQLKSQVNVLLNDLKVQKKYTEKVLKTLTQISKQSKKKPLTPYQKAYKLYKQKKYKEALPIYQSLLDNKKIKGKSRARILHNLGMIQYINKNYNQALIYFSRLYNEFPKIIFMDRGLYFLAKSMLALKKKAEAIQILEVLISDFPQYSKHDQAKSLLAELKKQ